MEITEKIKQIISDFHSKLLDDTTEEFYGFSIPEELLGLDTRVFMIPNKFLDTLVDWKDEFFVYPKNDINLHSWDLKKDTRYKCKYCDYLEIQLFLNDEEYGDVIIRFNQITTKTELVELFFTESEYLELNN
jgi:hypothetical protein